MAFIEVKNLSYKYNNYLSLDNVSFEIQKGSIIAIIGPNGSGKTTLLKNLIGLFQPDKGEVLIKGQDPQLMHHNIAYVPQHFDFDQSVPITVLEFIKLYQCGNYQHKENDKISNFLNKVGLLKVEKKLLGELSGGQFQRVLIARALLHEKEILILDEPMSGIDIIGEKTIYDLIIEINKKRKVTCLIVSHELSIVNKYIDFVICLNKKLCCFGKPEKIINSENLKKLFGKNTGIYPRYHI